MFTYYPTTLCITGTNESLTIPSVKDYIQLVDLPWHNTVSNCASSTKSRNKTMYKTLYIHTSGHRDSYIAAI